MWIEPKVNELKIGDSVYIRQTAPMSDEEEYRFYESVIYKIEGDKIYSKYITNNLKFNFKKEDVYYIEGKDKYYVNRFETRWNGIYG